MEIKIEDYEKLGAFYLGRGYDAGAQKATDDLVLYDSKDLVTHGVVLGMTGSGKTGLCLTLLEEAAMDNIPAIVIDPKGDLPNILLTFPELAGDDFEPWVNAEDAEKKGLSPTEYAGAQAALWKKGLGEWGQSGERIRQLREKVEFTVYTPGSNAGIPVSILASFQAPPFEVVDDAELFGERIESTVSSLLALVGIDADPLQSREHILLSNIIGTRWRAGENLTLARIIQDIQTPPFSQVGVVDLESFFSEKKRTELAMAVNSLLAAPGFQAWMSGVPLEMPSILRTPEGKPRIAIFSIAHLGDAERMFFVSLLLNQTIAWMRAQSGTTSLRALLYMDEIYGYLPPTANPPSKKPMLLLLKQARAFGVGVLLATQNPVDLDYKALANMGTWWLGRLQTERDKMRVLDGLEGAAASQNHGFDRAAMDRMLSGLGNRVFLMNNTHEDHPVLMQVRWTMSYLRGPLTRTQIKTLMDPQREKVLPKTKAAVVAPASGAPAQRRPAAVEIESEATEEPAPAPAAQKPALAKTITELFLPVTAPNPNLLPVVAVPAVIRSAEILFSDAKKALNGKKKVTLLTPLDAGQTAFDPADSVRLEDQGKEAFNVQPEPNVAEWRPLPAFALQSPTYTALKTQFTEECFANEGLELLCAEALDTWSQPGESERDFRARLAQLARERRDAATDELRSKFAKKAVPLEERLRRAQATVEKEKQEQKGAWMQTAVSVGTSVLGALLGRKTFGVGTMSKGASSIRQASQAWKQQGDVGRAEDTVQAVQALLDDLDRQCTAEMAALEKSFDAASMPLQKQAIPPMKKNIVVTAVGIAWLPHFENRDGSLEPAWS